MRLVLFQQLHHSEAVHADPEKLKKKILTELGGPGSGADPIARMMNIAREQQLEREAKAQ